MHIFAKFKFLTDLIKHFQFQSFSEIYLHIFTMIDFFLATSFLPNANLRKTYISDRFVSTLPCRKNFKYQICITKWIRIYQKCTSFSEDLRIYSLAQSTFHVFKFQINLHLHTGEEDFWRDDFELHTLTNLSAKFLIKQLGKNIFGAKIQIVEKSKFKFFVKLKCVSSGKTISARVL